jgi:hypothetical protein
MVGKADWHESSLIAANLGTLNQINANSNTKFQTPRSDVKVLAALSNDADMYLGGRKGQTNGNSASARGAIMAITGIRAASNTQVTIINENIVGTVSGTRPFHQAPWLLMGNAIFAGAAGILDLPRPVVTAVKQDGLDVTLEYVAQDTAAVAAGVTADIKYKISRNPIEPAYAEGDGWLNYNGTFKNSVWAGQYLHWYAINSEGVSSQGTIDALVPAPITSIRINGIAIETVRRGDTRTFTVTLNEGASPDNLVWSTANPALATVEKGGKVTVKNVIGTVVITATDPVSKKTHSILLRIAS